MKKEEEKLVDAGEEWNEIVDFLTTKSLKLALERKDSVSWRLLCDFQKKKESRGLNRYWLSRFSYYLRDRAFELLEELEKEPKKDSLVNIERMSFCLLASCLDVKEKEEEERL